MRGSDEIDRLSEGRDCEDQVESVNLPDGLDTIRDSRIATKWLLGRYPVTFGIRGWQPVRFHEDCERGASGKISRKARPL